MWRYTITCGSVTARGRFCLCYYLFFFFFFSGEENTQNHNQKDGFFKGSTTENTQIEDTTWDRPTNRLHRLSLQHWPGSGHIEPQDGMCHPLVQHPHDLGMRTADCGFCSVAMSFPWKSNTSETVYFTSETIICILCVNAYIRYSVICKQNFEIYFHNKTEKTKEPFPKYF